MPSSVIIVALAAAWLVVLVPMVARRRQQVAQNPHARVQISPRIINVAVRRSQHSPMFGQRALSQTVCSRSRSTRPRRSW